MELDKLYEQLTGEFPENAYNTDSSRGFRLIGIRGAFVIERLNATFGILGYGWRYVHSPFVWHDKEIVTEVALQYRLPKDVTGTLPYYWSEFGKAFDVMVGDQRVWSEPVFGVGGNRLGPGGVPTSDAQKSAISAAISKAASRLGVGIDAYKGNLETDDGGSISVKSDSTTGPGDKNKAIIELSKVVLVNAPGEYDKLAKAIPIIASHKKGLVAKTISAIENAGLTEFVSENLPVLVGDKGAKAIENLSATNLLLLIKIAKSISSGEVTWKQALEIAGSPGEKTWEESIAQIKNGPEHNDDSE